MIPLLVFDGVHETYRLSFNGRLHPPVGTDDVHDDALSDAGPQKTATAAEGISDKGEENRTGSDLDDSVYTGGEETRVRTDHAKVCEDLRSIIILSK
jgi:hypothetical protein